jgi:hypothetical protein
VTNFHEMSSLFWEHAMARPPNPINFFYVNDHLIIATNEMTSRYSGLPILCRSRFDQGVEIFLKSEPTSNLSWYALYNAVLAIGCRASEMSVSIESPSSFQDSEKEAWQYFRNAFSVHTELLYQRTDIAAVLVCHPPTSIRSELG